MRGDKDMSKINDGGAAFPQLRITPTGHYSESAGMSLRDWFAGQALTGILAHGSVGNHADIASNAYRFADAMLAERAKPEGR